LGQHEIIIVFGRQLFDYRLAANVGLQTVLDYFGKIRTPAPEVVVDINDRHTGSLGAALEGGKSTGHRQRISQQIFTSLEIDRVNYIDQKKGRLSIIRRMVQTIAVTSRLGHSILPSRK
jgi:ABC-type Fe2+-enterobactin transport system substrate-binding protein